MFDVVIIGAGVTGSAIAREVSRYKLNTCVIEKEEDVCNETSKANSAIIHAGFDAVPGTMKAKLNVMGNAMMDRIAEELDIPFKRNGSLVVCTKEQDPEGLQVLMERGKKNGVPGLQILDREALIEKEPNLADDVTCALWAPTGGIVCPFHMTMGYAENAYENGVRFFLNTKVEKLEKTGEGFRVTQIPVLMRQSRQNLLLMQQEFMLMRSIISFQTESFISQPVKGNTCFWIRQLEIM